VTGATSFLTGAGGRRIFWRTWLPEGEARAVIVLVHGASEHSGRYEHVASALVADGYAVYALDHRGHGRSDGPRAVIDRLDNAVADLDQLVLEARRSRPGSPVYMLGHSMGGTVALAYAIRHQPDDLRAAPSGEAGGREQDDPRAAPSSEAGGRAGRKPEGRHERLAGLILSGPLAALAAAPAPLRLVGRLLSAVAPTLPLVAIDASLVSRDPEVVKAYVSDPLVHHGKLPARTVAELATAIDSFPAAVGAITIPTLILYGTADRLCPPAGSLMLGERIGATDKTVKAYEGLYHEILNEPERDEVLADIRAWLSLRVTPVAGRDAAGSPAGSSTT
jgi:acylglycerol lipase